MATGPGADGSSPDDKASGQLLLIRLLPNFVSILSLCAGLTAIRLAVAGDTGSAVFLVALAAALDGLDGRLARMLNSESAIGAELDSLCDFVNFGVVPGLVLYLWGLESESRLGWIAVLVYAVCCMLRLARFNVGNRNPDPVEKTTFVGVPSPAGALLALVPIYLQQVTGYTLPALSVAVWMVGVGALMISRLRTPSVKRVRIAAWAARYVLVAAVAIAAALVSYPWVTLLALSVSYLAGIAALGIGVVRKRTKT